MNGIGAECDGIANCPGDIVRIFIREVIDDLHGENLGFRRDAFDIGRRLFLAGCTVCGGAVGGNDPGNVLAVGGA